MHCGGKDRKDLRCIQENFINSSHYYYCRFNGVFVFVQSIVPDLSYTVRSPMLDTWEGIKQLKAALWALVSIFTPFPHHRNEPP